MAVTLDYRGVGVCVFADVLRLGAKHLPDIRNRCFARSRKDAKDSKKKPQVEGENDLRLKGLLPSKRQTGGSPLKLSYLIFTSICFGFASSRFGKVIINKPSLNSARILLASMKAGNVNVLRNSP